MAAHALLSASGSKRWMTCTPSARLEEMLPEKKGGGGKFAQEGTHAHAYAEIKLRLLYNQIDLVEYQQQAAEMRQSEFYNADFEHYVDQYVLYCRNLVGEGDIPFVEQRVDYSQWAQEGFGTADFVVISKDKLIICDLKFGQGVFVSVKQNSQLRLYALGAYSKFKDQCKNIKTVEYHVAQPRYPNFGFETITIEQLLEWAENEVKPAAKLAWAGHGKFAPSDEACQFCKAKNQCKARADVVTNKALLDFRNPDLLTDEEIIERFEIANQLKSYLNNIQEYLTDRAVAGNVPNGYELKETVKHRVFTDSRAVEQTLHAAGYSPDVFTKTDLLTVSQMEKALGKKKSEELLGSLIEKPAGDPKLVKAKVSF